MQEPKNRVKIAGLCAEIDHARTKINEKYFGVQSLAADRVEAFSALSGPRARAGV